MEVISRGRLILAGKAEALFMREEYRKGSAEAKGMFVPGLALIARAHTLAWKNGIHLLFGLPPKELSPIFKATGFSQLNARLNHRYFLLRPKVIRQLDSQLWKRTAASALSLAQKCSHRLSCLGASSLLPTLRSDSICDAHRLHRIAAHHFVEPDRWSVALTEKSLSWWLRMRYLKVITVDENDEEYVLIVCGAPNSNLQIVHWNFQDNDTLRALTILRYIVRIANQQRAATISFATKLAGNRSLSRAATILGFFSWPVERVMFVKSNDPFYAVPDNLHFNSLFSI
jgi:hypothetical protein